MLWRRSIVLVTILLAVIQLAPYGRDHTNPPVAQEPPWDGAKTRKLAMDACYSCHSNETEWPWYSNVAPMSWLIQRDVDEGREALNFSRFDIEQNDADKAAETVADGEMPPLRYELANANARLDDDERRALVAGLRRTFGGDDDDGRG